MNRADKERKKQIELIKKILVGVIGIAILSLVILVAVLVKPKTQIKGDEESLASEILSKDNRDEAKLVYGGDTETFDKLNFIVNTFLNEIRAGDYEGAYGRWDVDLLKSYGFSYLKEQFISYYNEFLNKYHLSNGDSKHVNFSYEPVTYQDYGAYYLFTFNTAFTYYNDTGKIVTTGQNEFIYTIEKYDFNGSTVYRLLDFNIQDVSLYAARFDEKTDNGLMVSPGIYLNEKEESKVSEIKSNGDIDSKTRYSESYNPYGAKD